MAAVTECRIMDGYPTADEDASLQTTYEARYKIKTDNADFRNVREIRALARAADPHKLPSIGDIYSDPFGAVDAGSFCQSVKVVPNADPCRNIWYAVARWKPLPQGTRPSDIDPNLSPLDRPKRVWLETITETAQIAKGWNQIELPKAGEGFQPRAEDTEGPIVNAAGESYDEALYEDDSYAVYVQEKNVASPEAAYSLQKEFGRSLNMGEFLTFPEDHAKFLSAETGPPTSEQIGDVLFEYYVMQVRIALRDEPWYHDIVNRGMHEIVQNRFTLEVGLHDIYVPSNNTVVTRQVPASEPVLLDINGLHLKEGVLGNTIPYRTRKRKDYAGLLI